jgi:hypothetical protein
MPSSAKTVKGGAIACRPAFALPLKLPQEITHENRLRNSADQLALFAERARLLGDKLGPILIQLGPDFAPVELPALASFLPTLPHDLDFAIEFRQRGWIHDGIIALLAEHRVALALTDARWIPRKSMLALAERPTSDVAYVRWMGPNRDLVDYSRIQVDRSRRTVELGGGPAGVGQACAHGLRLRQQPLCRAQPRVASRTAAAAGTAVGSSRGSRRADEPLLDVIARTVDGSWAASCALASATVRDMARHLPLAAVGM